MLVKWIRENPSVVIMYVLGIAFLGIGAIVLLTMVRGFANAVFIGGHGDNESRSIVGGIFVCFIFSFVGAAITALAVPITVEQRRFASRQVRYPKQPWRWRDDWDAGKVVHKWWLRLIGLSFVAIIWNAMSWGCGTFILMSKDEEKFDLFVLLIIGTFCFVGLGFIVKVAYRVLAAHRWGTSHLTLATLPAEIGGSLLGVVNVARSISPDAEVIVLMTCKIRRRFRQKLYNTEVGEATYYDDTLWQAAKLVTNRLPPGDARQTLLPVAFDIPTTAVATRVTPNVSWELTVLAFDGWPTYQAEFDVPVFRVRRQHPRHDDSHALLSDCLAPLDFEQLLRLAGGTIIHKTQDAIDLKFKMVRSLNTATAVIGAILLIILACRITIIENVTPWLRFGMPLVGLIVLVAATIDSFSSFVVSATPQGVSRVRSFAGLRIKRFFKAEGISDIIAKTVFYQNGFPEGVVLLTKNGKSHRLFPSVQHRVVGEAIANKLKDVVHPLNKKIERQVVEEPVI